MRPRPTVRPDWKMPDPPVERAVPTYYIDGGEVYLHWHDPVSGEVSTPESDIPWPFEEDYAERGDFERLGFRDAEDLPEE